MNNNQSEIFLNSEGDQWFHRNKTKILEKFEMAEPLQPILEVVQPGMKILEVGCSFGSNLNYLHSKVPELELYGIDPSKEAIGEGQRLYPFCDFKVGVASQIALFPVDFDIIFFGFCLYLVDRGELPAVVEAVKLKLNRGGFLGIIDFDTKTPIRKNYAHFKGVTTYKDDYSQIFLQDPEYYLVSKKSWSHLGGGFHREIDERCSTQLIYREYNHLIR